MTLFLSTTINKIDKKGRVSVPAHFRAALTHQSFAGIVVFPSLHSCALEGCGYERLQKLSDQQDTLDLIAPQDNNAASMIFAEAQLLAFDAEGRISLPKHLLEFAKITDQVAFVGRGATFQIWQPQALEVHQQLLKKQYFLHSSPSSINNKALSHE